MSCEIGRTIHEMFEKAVATRILIETKNAGYDEITEAKADEITALRSRAYHIRECEECWLHPPGPPNFSPSRNVALLNREQSLCDIVESEQTTPEEKYEALIRLAYLTGISIGDAANIEVERRTQ